MAARSFELIVACSAAWIAVVFAAGYSLVSILAVPVGISAILITAHSVYRVARSDWSNHGWWRSHRGLARIIRGELIPTLAFKPDTQNALTASFQFFVGAALFLLAIRLGTKA